jgi:hypothetical protein
MLKPIAGGFTFESTDERLLLEQRAITGVINNNFIQVGAVFLKPSGKMPFEDNWFSKGPRDTDLQSWIDDPDRRLLNVGFNLQFGWVDVDIDSGDVGYNRCIIAAMNHLGIDTRFQFGRASLGSPSHVLVQLNESEASNFNQLKQFEPNEFKLKGGRYKVELRSFATDTAKANIPREAKQTVMPGSIYVKKDNPSIHDISVWYCNGNATAHSIADVAVTTPHKTEFNSLIRAIAFGTALYLFRPQWVEGSRQSTASKISGWLARVVQDSNGLNNHEAIADDVFCPIDSDGIAESLIEFVCKEMGDEEPYMRVRTYRDACGKLLRNPDAKIPGWPSMAQLFGDEVINALRAVLMPGADVSILTKLAERYIYDETDDLYIDRDRFQSFGTFAHSGNELDRRHRGDFVRVGGKLRPAFKLFEISTIRKRVNVRDLYPDLRPGGIFRIDRIGEQISDDDDEPTSNVAFNTWKGWPIAVAQPVNFETLELCNKYLDQLLAYLTRDNLGQALWMKQWIAWTIQHPGDKQQVAPVIVGGQGVGKSFFGNTFLRMILQSLWGTASPKLLEGAFSIEPFIGKMVVFIDEAKFHSEESTEEIKKLIRNVNIGGAEKFQSARNYRIFSRIVFASNHFDMNLGQANVQDRALFYIKAYDKDHLRMSSTDFRQWTVTLKPFFDEFQALLNRKDVREHYMYIFSNLEVDRHVIEDTTHSSSTDNEIIASNMSWARRIAKYIIEEGRIIEDCDISMPFGAGDLNKKVSEVCKELGMLPVQGARVLAEFKEAGVIEVYTENSRNLLRFKFKIGTLTDKFGQSISVAMEPKFQFTEDDFGDNDTTLASPKNYKGISATLFRRI